jgi:hypothetical protein
MRDGIGQGDSKDYMGWPIAHVKVVLGTGGRVLVEQMRRDCFSEVGNRRLLPGQRVELLGL